MVRDNAGNRPGTARLIQLSSQPTLYRDRIGATDPSDYYRFRLNQPTSFNLVLDSLTANANVRLINRAGRTIETSINRGKRAETIHGNLAAGTYYIQVFGRQATRYRMTVSAFPDRAGDRPATALDLGTVGNTFVDDWVGTSDPADYYSFTINGYSLVDLTLKNLVADANVQLLETNGTVLQTATNSGTGDELRSVLLNAGRYYVSVVPATPSSNIPYRLELQAVPTAPLPINDPVPPLAPLPNLKLEPFVSGFNKPTHITSARDGSDRLFVVEQAGRIRLIQNGTLLPNPFLTISNRVSQGGGEEGLLSLAFPPNYGRKGYFYVYYTNPSGNNVVARYRVTGNTNVADPNSEEILLTINHPNFSNHNGGQLAFGADGYLYIGTGDGGGGGDPNNQAQNPNSLLGKILRIDVESPGATPYQIPATNPFTGAADPGNLTRDQIWAFGLRNPWRFSFDRQTGDLYIGDVGQGSVEEINVQLATSPGGENYGWKRFEGSQAFANPSGSRMGLVFPIAEYDRSQGSSVIGGFVYRGATERRLQGVYLYGDFSSGNLWGLRRNGNDWENKLLLDSPYNISTFGEDEAGNLYITDFSSGALYKIQALT